MAPRVNQLLRDGKKLRAQADSEYTDPSPCQYCGGGPTRHLEVTPATYANKRLVTAPKFAYLCNECRLQLRIPDTVMTNAAWVVESRKARLAEQRQESRQEMWANQGQLAGLEDTPTDPITGG